MRTTNNVGRSGEIRRKNGNYGEQADLLIFDSNALTPQQWETLGEVNDNNRYEYVEAIFNGKDLTEWEQ